MGEKIEKIKQQVIECTKCELSKTRTNSVAGKGNFKSDVIFVGEAPGKNEDLKGEPFIGIAGKKLSIALESAGITREEVYITILLNVDRQIIEFQHQLKETHVKNILKKKQK